MERRLNVAVAVILVAVISAAPPSTDVPPHNVFSVNYNTQRQELYTGEQFVLPLEDLHFEFSSTVYERQDPLEDNILDDFEGQLVRNTNTYKVISFGIFSRPIAAGYNPAR